MECKSLFCWKIAFLECTLSYLPNFILWLKELESALKCNIKRSFGDVTYLSSKIPGKESR